MNISETRCYGCPDRVTCGTPWHETSWYCRFNMQQRIVLKEGQKAPEWCRRSNKLDLPHWDLLEIVDFPHHKQHYVYVGAKNFINDIWLMTDYQDPIKSFGIWGIDYFDRDHVYLGFEYHDNYDNKYYISCDYVNKYLADKKGDETE